MTSVFSPKCALCAQPGPVLSFWAGFSTHLREQRKLDRQDCVFWCEPCIDRWVAMRHALALSFLVNPPRLIEPYPAPPGPCTRCGALRFEGSFGGLDLQRGRAPGYSHGKGSATSICTTCYEVWRGVADEAFTAFVKTA